MNFRPIKAPGNRCLKEYDWPDNGGSDTPSNYPKPKEIFIAEKSSNCRIVLIVISITDFRIRIFVKNIKTYERYEKTSLSRFQTSDESYQFMLTGSFKKFPTARERISRMAQLPIYAYTACN